MEMERDDWYVNEAVKPVNTQNIMNHVASGGLK
jgi:hypothetical protein